MGVGVFSLGVYLHSTKQTEYIYNHAEPVQVRNMWAVKKAFLGGGQGSGNRAGGNPGPVGSSGLGEIREAAFEGEKFSPSDAASLIFPARYYPRVRGFPPARLPTLPPPSEEAFLDRPHFPYLYRLCGLFGCIQFVL